MADLREPDKPAGFVVEVDPETGVATRNDGGLLQPAEKNPWYVLATIAGEPDEEDDLDAELHARNRKFWNGWACSQMSGEKRAELAERLDLPVSEFEQSEDEKVQVAAEFARRLPGEEMPAPSESVDFRETHFRNSFRFLKCVVASDASLRSATFSGYASFGSATFSGDAWFGSATFSGDAWFGSATFSGSAWFGSATFSGDAWFRSATFSGDAWFGSATFSGDAWFESATFKRGAFFGSATFSGNAGFRSATFSGDADFSNEKFGATTDFAGAHFKGGVPEFYERAFHQDTDIPTDPDNWPEITKGNAGTSKRAYTRLRQVMNGLHKPDAEAFFGRQEMRCDAELNGAGFRVLSRGYGAVSGYGHSILLPAAWLAGLVVVCGGILGSYLMHGQGVEGAAAIAQGMGLSIANSFPYLGFQRLYFESGFTAGLNPWIKLLGGVQTVAGGVLLFFLLLGLRNRFRLK